MARGYGQFRRRAIVIDTSSVFCFFFFSSPFALPAATYRGVVGQHGPAAGAQRHHQLDGVPADRQREGQRPDLQVRRAAGGQDPRPGGSPEPDGPLHHRHLDEARAQSRPQGREGDAAV